MLKRRRRRRRKRKKKKKGSQEPKMKHMKLGSKIDIFKCHENVV
jgi:hypothetical protein